MSENKKIGRLTISLGQSGKNEDLISITTYVILFFTTVIFLIGDYVPLASWQFYITIFLSRVFC